MRIAVREPESMLQVKPLSCRWYPARATGYSVSYSAISNRCRVKETSSSARGPFTVPSRLPVLIVGDAVRSILHAREAPRSPVYAGAKNA